MNVSALLARAYDFGVGLGKPAEETVVLTPWEWLGYRPANWTSSPCSVKRFLWRKSHVDYTSENPQ